jgi:hypothetical protein
MYPTALSPFHFDATLPANRQTFASKRILVEIHELRESLPRGTMAVPALRQPHSLTQIHQSGHLQV